MRDAEDAEFEGSRRRAVAGCAEVWNRDVHVEDLILSLFVKFDGNPASRLEVRGVFVPFKTGGMKVQQLTFAFVVRKLRRVIQS